MSHVMIDLETLASRKDACIIQLAAIRFDPLGENVDRDDVKKFSAHVWHKNGYISLSTVAWWMQQEHAKEMGEALKEHGSKPGHVLPEFDSWIGDPEKIDGIWSHGASFDLAVLSSLYDQEGRWTPWKFRSERDTRTVFWLAGGAPEVPNADLQKHEAVSDCIYQARQVQESLRILRSRGLDVSHLLSTMEG